MTKQINGDKLFVINPHPAIPPADQLKKWEDKWFNEEEHADVLLIQAFQAGANQELEACCELLPALAEYLRNVRRPKPPSLKEQALESLERMQDQYPHLGNAKTIRRALEALDD
jgi:hypothetical protein